MTDQRHVGVALGVPALTLAVAIATFPHIFLSDRATALVTFLGAAGVAVLGVSLGAYRAVDRRTIVAIDVAAIVVLALIAVLRIRTPWIAIVVDSALIAFAWATGAAIGEKVEHPSHLLPAAAVAAAADVVSVASSWGPSAAIAASERALSVLAISFPVLGTRAIAPALGVGDLVFIGLALGAARAHQLPYRRMAILAFVGVVLAGFGSAYLDRAVPALPAIGLMMVAFVPGARTLRRKDRSIATVAIGISIVVAVLAIVRSRR